MKKEKKENPKFTIGQVVYIRKDFNGAMFKDLRVCGETSRSWIMMSATAQEWETERWEEWGRGYPKNFKGFVLGTEREFRLSHWVGKHASKISAMVSHWGSRVDDETMLKVAQVIGYPEKFEEVTVAET